MSKTGGFDIVGLGAAVHDTIIVTDTYPKEDTKQAASKTIIQGGGPTATALVACSKLGLSTAYIGSVGDDEYGRFIQDDFDRYGVDTSGILVREGCASLHAFVILAKNKDRGTRTILFNRGNAPAPSISEVDPEIIRKAKVLHLDGNQLDISIHAAVTARAAGVKVSMDAGGAYPGVERLLPLIDFLIPAEEFALKFTGLSDPHKAAEELYKRFNPEFVIVTRGPAGGFAYNGKEHIPYPPYDAVVVDSNGAGDVFHGAFITGYVKGMDMMQAANFASAVSALKCTGIGARKSVPSYEEAIKFLKRSGYNGI